MSLNKPNSHYHGTDLFVYQRRSSNSRPPIACRVCDRVFFDTFSHLLHFECHLKDDDDQASWRSGPLSLSLSLHPCSSVERRTEARHAVSPTNDCSRHGPLPVSSATTPNLGPKNSSLVHIPVLNSMPPITSSFNSQVNPSPPVHHSTMSPDGATSSSTPPLMYSQLDDRGFACGSAASPPLRLRQHSWRQARFSDLRNSCTNQPQDSTPEIIMISDDEEDGDRNASEIDLTLKL